MAKKAPKPTKEVDITELKKLKLFESIYVDFNTQLGFSVCYTRVFGGVIRLVITPESVSQVFINLPESFF